MATADVARSAREHPVAVTAALSAIGYALVIGTFLGALPDAAYPDLALWQVNRLADAIAVVNTVATASLALGWYWIRQGDVRRHRAAMLTAFGLILVFLVLYLLKVGGGGTKEFDTTLAPAWVYYGYLAMLAIHVLLSILSVPLVVYQVVTGVSHSTAELRRRTRHRRVGKIAAGAWILSLSLGVVTYLLLNHVYGWRFQAAAIVFVP